MPERKWTERQLDAINTRGKTLLISAAAGAGKTATLTERIIRSVTDPETPADITRLLIVTFTNDAANELRERIETALEEAVRRSPGNKRLERQLALLPSAKIRTIDSFLNEILKANASTAGLSPNYRIADTPEIAVLENSVMESLINCTFEGLEPEIASGEEFAGFCDELVGIRDSGDLGKHLLDIYYKTKSLSGSVSALDALRNQYSPDGDILSGVEKTAAGKYILDKAGSMLSHYSHAYTKMISLLPEDGEAGDTIAKFLRKELEKADELRASLQNGFFCFSDKLRNFSFATYPSISADKKGRICISAKALRDDFKAAMLKFEKDYLQYTETQWKDLYAGLYSNLGTLVRFLHRFDERMKAEKKKKNIIEYSDIERYCADLLTDGDGPSDLALSLREDYDEIYIDEYQDINEVQGKIFDALCRPDNRFAVGDIKQSIYGFRNADPSVFSGMKKSYPPLSESQSSNCASIYMSENFRCDKGIIDFANEIFNSLFSVCGDSIGYTSEDALIFAKAAAADMTRLPEIIMCRRNPKSGDEDEDADSGSDEAAEAEAISAEIKRLVSSEVKNDSSPLHYSDIAVIIRRAHGSALKYAEIFKKHGIPSVTKESEDFFLSPEILLMLCFLNAVDNPRRDVYLAGLMLSPLFDFTPDELLEIRKSKNRSATLYESLRSYVDAHPSYTKGSAFIAELSRYRELSEGIPVYKLISGIYRKTGILSLAAENGGKEKLLMLYNYARNFEASSLRGLYSFIAYINEVINNKKTIDFHSGENVGADAVRITTVHSSKGLEYPVCFVAGLNKPMIKKQDARRLITDGKTGIAMRLSDESGFVRVNNPVFNAIRNKLRDEATEEEFRVLYVALTRARERLYLVYCAKDPEKLSAAAELKTLFPSKYSYMNFSSFAELILALAPERRVRVFSGDDGCAENEESPAVVTGLNTAKNLSPEEEREQIELIGARIKKRLGFIYPKEYLRHLPAKLSVSSLFPGVLDGSDDESEVLKKPERRKDLLPSFLSGKESDEGAKRGIATHLFMQFCDFDALAENGVESELKRLVDKGFLSEEDAARARVDELNTFARSELFKQIRSSSEIHREFRFNVKLSAADFTKDESLKELLHGRELLVQGVIDCIFRDRNGALVIIDYKTDRLSRRELEDEEEARRVILARHSEQLIYYRAAAEKIFGERISECSIYSLCSGKKIIL